MKASDVLVIGGGVFGLWAARACRLRGMSVTLAEAGRIGGGASGGPVGALAPHMPARWDEKKAFQLAALEELPAVIARLEADAGISTGYGRIGRVTPLPDARRRAEAEHRAGEAARRWPGARMEVLEESRWPGWAAPGAAGLVWDDLTARLAPAAYCRALAASLAGADLREGWRMLDWRAGVVRFDRGEIRAGATILAAGWESFGLLKPLLGRAPGGGVKGQAMLLDVAAPPGAPMIQDRDVFVAPQAAGGVAVGSTSEKVWEDLSTDARLEALRETAEALCPALVGARVRMRWAGVRPRARHRDPMVGPVPGHAGLIAATGGFKIGFGVAHAIGELAAGLAAGEPYAGPERFLVERHLAG